jgi:hypothetical protein
LHLGDEVGIVRQFIASSSKTFAVGSAFVEESLEIVFGDGRADGLGLGEVRLVPVAEGGLAVGELTVVRVEGIGASS